MSNVAKWRTAESKIAFAMGQAQAKGVTLKTGMFGLAVDNHGDLLVAQYLTTEYTWDGTRTVPACACAIGCYLVETGVPTRKYQETAAAAVELGVSNDWTDGLVSGFDLEGNDELDNADKKAGYKAGKRLRKIAGINV